MRNIKIVNIAVVFTIVIVVALGGGIAYSYDSLLRPETGFGEDRKAEMFKRFKEAFRKQYGGKAFGTMELLQEYAKRFGFKVPEFENIGTDIFKGFLEHNSITREKINGIYAENLITNDISKGYMSRKGLSVDSIGKKAYDSSVYQQIKELFYKGKFTEEQEKELRKVFDAMRALGFPIIAIRSSSVLEDSEEHQFKGVYESEFLYFSQDAKKDFELFKEKVKKVYATIFSPKARAYLEENNIPDTDEMGILVQRVVGKSHGNKFYPPLSGVTLFEPYSPNTTVSYLNLGLNTKTVRGEYMWKWVCITDASGQRHISGSDPTLESKIGQVKKEYDIIDTFGTRVIENYSDGRSYDHSLFRSYSYDKADFLQKVNGDLPNMEFTKDFAFKINDITRGLRKGKGKPVEIEWSVDDDGNINIYQDRYSYDFEKFYAESIELPNIPSERIIAESSLVSGHKEISAPLILVPVVPDGDSLEAFMGIYIAKDRIGDNYILAVDLAKLINGGIGITAEFIPANLPGMIGVLNISDEPVPLGAHWSESLIVSNMPIISTTQINRDLLNKVCDNNTVNKVRYSKVPVKMVVNGIKQKGRLWVPEKETLGKGLPVTLNEKVTHNASSEDL